MIEHHPAIYILYLKIMYVNILKYSRYYNVQKRARKIRIVPCYKESMEEKLPGRGVSVQ